MNEKRVEPKKIFSFSISQPIHDRKIRYASLIISLILLAFFSYFYLLPVTAEDSTSLLGLKRTVGKVEPVSKDFGLLIPSIGANLPVVTDVDGASETVYLEALQRGVAHYKGTAKPGGSSNIFIFGHSSDWRWHKGDYKKAFEKLPEVKKDDLISVFFQNKEYKYTVTETQVVEPNALNWLDPTNKEVLTLMTCYPIGTDKQRFIVRAELAQN